MRESLLLLRFVRLEEEGALREDVRDVKRLLGDCRAVLPVPEGLAQWAKGIGREEGFEVLPYRSSPAGLLGLLRSLRRRRFRAAVLSYDGSRWGHLKLEALLLLSGAERLYSLLGGRLRVERRALLALRAASKALLIPLFALTACLGLVALATLVLTDLLSLLSPSRRRLRPNFSPLRGDEGISVVVPSRNGRHLLERNLPSLKRALDGWGGRWEVIVADDASTDGTVEFLRERFPWARAVRAERWRGFGPTCNMGVREARFPLVLLLNNDVEVTEGFIGPLVERLASDPSIFAVGSKFGPTVESLSLQSPELEEHVGAPAGCGLFDGRKLRYLGGFDPLFAPFYWEENDLGMRAWRRGWRCVYDGRSLVVHRMGSSIRRLHKPGYVQWTFLRNKFLFAWKNLTDFRLLLLHFLLLPLRLAQDVTILSGPYWTRALLEALWRLPKVAARRARERGEEVVPLSRLAHLFRAPSPLYFV